MEWKRHPQCGFPEVRVTDHVCPSQPVHTRESLGIVIMKENLGFSLLRQQNRTIHPSLASKGEERRGHRREKD